MGALTLNCFANGLPTLVVFSIHVFKDFPALLPQVISKELCRPGLSYVNILLRNRNSAFALTMMLLLLLGSNLPFFML